MSGFFKKLLGLMLLLATMGLVTCQSLYKVATTPSSAAMAPTQPGNQNE